MILGKKLYLYKNKAAGDPAAPFLLTAERLLETPPPPGPPGGGCA